MFTEWISLRSSIEEKFGVQSVLQNYPPNVGKDVASHIVHSLQYSDKSKALQTKEQLDWTMEVICYGLTMPMTEIDLIRNCAFLYVDWITTIANASKVSIPKPILDDSQFYFKKILRHLGNLFLPRESSSSKEQGLLCSQVIHQIRSIPPHSLEKGIWEDLLLFFLGISGHLLSPPPSPNGLAEHLCDQLVNTLFFVWLLAAHYKFPSPPLWATLQDFCLSWRHHKTLIAQWSKLMCSLTHKVLQILYGSHCLPDDALKEDFRFTIPDNLASEMVVQCWFRFLHILGTPVDLSIPEKITNTPHFMQFKLEYPAYLNEHASIKTLPDSFLKAMKGVSVLVDMFLDVRYIRQGIAADMHDSNLGHFNEPNDAPSQCETLHSLDMLSSILTVPGPMSPKHSKPESPSGTPKAAHSIASFSIPSVNSILHIFGGWLFDATLSGVELEKILKSFGALPNQLLSDTFATAKGFPPKKDEFQHGRAEAFSILCHIFSSQKANENILPVYLGRFYLSLAIGLCYKMTYAGHVLSSILMSAEDILRIDLQGVQVLVPHIIKALEITLPVPERELILGNHYPSVELKRSSIQLLLSMLCLPLHFLSLEIESMWQDPHSQDSPSDKLTFLALKPRLTSLLMEAFEVETDAVNIQMLLGGVMLLLQDTVAVETMTSSNGSHFPKPNIILQSMQHSTTQVHVTRSKDDIEKPVEISIQIDPQNACKDNSRPRVGSLGDSRDMGTTKGLFYHIVPLLCQKLMFSTEWRTDMNVTLTALELLADLARLDARFIDEAESKKCLKWICNYISFQANKPAPSHVRDLHSIIVAAFNCLSQWILNHHWLLDDQSCLVAVLEVVELGISGTKSKVLTIDGSQILKGEKELKPVSFRVREAAECVLAYIMEQTGAFPNPNGPASLSTLLDEESLLFHAIKGDRKKFLFFAMDGSSIISILEDTVDKSLAHLPSVTSIIRGPTGKTASLMQLRFFSRSKQAISQAYLNEPPRPASVELGQQPSVINKTFYPEAVDSVQKVQAEYSIPDTNDMMEENLNESQDQMKTLMQLQTELEQAAQGEAAIDGIMCKEEKQPTPQTQFRAAKLYLSHLGLLNLNGIEKAANRPFARLLPLKSEDENFENSLKALDRMSSRTYDKLYAFIVRKNKTDWEDILKNEITSEDEHFIEFIMSLGWPVTVGVHPGWTGSPNTSWLRKGQSTEAESDGTIGDQILYFSDATTELAILVPALNARRTESPEFLTPRGAEDDENDSPSPTRSTFRRSESEEIVAEQPIRPPQIERRLSDPSETKVLRKQTTMESSSAITETKMRGHSSTSETQVVVAWLQDFNDHFRFPVSELLSNLEGVDFPQTANTVSRVPEREICIIFIHPLKTGLYRVKVRTVFGTSVGGPLVDGMVVSRRVLGTMVRSTALNFCRRRRLDIDNYSPPHTCRKIKIQDIIKNFSQETNVPEFFASIFQNDLLE